MSFTVLSEFLANCLFTFTYFIGFVLAAQSECRPWTDFHFPKPNDTIRERSRSGVIYTRINSLNSIAGRIMIDYSIHLRSAGLCMKDFNLRNHRSLHSPKCAIAVSQFLRFRKTIKSEKLRARKDNCVSSFFLSFFVGQFCAARRRDSLIARRSRAKPVTHSGTRLRSAFLFFARRSDSISH